MEENIETNFSSYASCLRKESEQLSNPLKSQIDNTKYDLNEYVQTVPRPKYDENIAQIIEVVRILNNLAPVRMPEYNFNADEINGERFFKPDGTLLLIRDFDNNVVRDYYYNKDFKDKKYSISRILEHDKNTGKLKVKIEPITRAGSRIKTGITVFDNKLNNKYMIIQLSEGGIVNNISEFTDKGKSFKTLFRNINNFKPVRYLEGKDNPVNGFEMIDCLFTNEGNVARIKKYNNKREVSIDYKGTQKQISVKNKQN